MVELNGTELTIEQVMAVARHKEQVRISEPAKQKIDRARAYVDEKLAQKAVIYGLTTGFGKFSDTFVIRRAGKFCAGLLSSGTKTIREKGG